MTDTDTKRRSHSGDEGAGPSALAIRIGRALEEARNEAHGYLIIDAEIRPLLDALQGFTSVVDEWREDGGQLSSASDFIQMIEDAARAAAPALVDAGIIVLDHLDIAEREARQALSRVNGGA